VKNFSVIKKSNMEHWFSASTEADYQLKETMVELARDDIFYPTKEQINRDLFGVDNVYSYIPYFEPPYHGDPSLAHISWEDMDYLFNRISDGEIRVIVEVGSFCGASACFIGEYIKKNKIPAVIICVDTWCGDINMWLKGNFSTIMSKQDGQPKLFENFISTVRRYNMQDVIVPLRVSSVVAARMLAVLKYKIDIVYLDSAHEAGETFMELNLYYDLLKKGGVIFGDDYKVFPAVRKDVDLFSKLIEQDISFCDHKDKNNPIWSFIKE